MKPATRETLLSLLCAGALARPDGAGGLTLNEQPAVSPGTDWDELCRVAQEQQIAPIIAMAAEGLDPPQAVRAKLDAAARDAALLEATLHCEMEAAFACFEREGVDYCPLKGLTTKYLYPLPWMRTMRDADVLLRPDDLPRVRSLMTALGFIYQSYYSVHDTYLNATGLYRVELHDALLSTWSVYHTAFEDGWARLLRKPDTHRFKMSSEDQYLYALLHAQKHMDHEGVSLRVVTDLFLLRRALPDGAKDRVRAIGLTAFAEDMQALAKAWFERGPYTPRLRQLEAYLLACGDTQNPLQRQYNRERLFWQHKRRTPHYRGIRRIFLPYEALCRRYPSLTGHRALLPLYWARDLLHRTWAIPAHEARLLALRLRGARPLQRPQAEDEGGTEGANRSGKPGASDADR